MRVALIILAGLTPTAAPAFLFSTASSTANPSFAEQPAFVDHFSAGWETTQSDWRVATWMQNGTQMSKDRCKTDGLGHMVQTVLAGGPPYYGGSMQSDREFGFGRWVARVKPTSVPGVLNSIFTKDWDDFSTPGVDGDGSMAEVDIELLSYTFGVNTGKVHIAIHLAGRNNYVSENLGLNFNPSDDFHEWGFDILPDRVVWHVDGNPLYTWMYDFEDDAFINENYEMFMNSWTKDWWILGPPATDADYLIDWIKFYPMEP